MQVLKFLITLAFCKFKNVKIKCDVCDKNCYYLNHIEFLLILLTRSLPKLSPSLHLSTHTRTHTARQSVTQSHTHTDKNSHPDQISTKTYTQKLAHRQHTTQTRKKTQTHRHTHKQIQKVTPTHTHIYRQTHTHTHTHTQLDSSAQSDLRSLAP